MISEELHSESIPSPFQLAPGVWMVPCKASESQEDFVPVLRPFKNGPRPKDVPTRQGWSMHEDEALAEIVSELGPKKWSCISVELNIRVHNGLPIRKGKQCRERWTGCLSPDIVRAAWTEEEDKILTEKQKLWGNKWCLIIKELPGRTENQIKNRWRQIEKMNRVVLPKVQIPEFNQGPQQMNLVYWPSGGFFDVNFNFSY
jgi:hypothetical protein